jgi:hypothetical protein
VNASETDIEFALPCHGGKGWSTLIDTARAPQPPASQDRYPLNADSLVLLRLTP